MLLWVVKFFSPWTEVKLCHPVIDQTLESWIFCPAAETSLNSLFYLEQFLWWIQDFSTAPLHKRISPQKLSVWLLLTRPRLNKRSIKTTYKLCTIAGKVRSDLFGKFCSLKINEILAFFVKGVLHEACESKSIYLVPNWTLGFWKICKTTENDGCEPQFRIWEPSSEKSKVIYHTLIPFIRLRPPAVIWARFKNTLSKSSKEYSGWLILKVSKIKNFTSDWKLNKDLPCFLQLFEIVILAFVLCLLAENLFKNYLFIISIDVTQEMFSTSGRHRLCVRACKRPHEVHVKDNLILYTSL